MTTSSPETTSSHTEAGYLLAYELDQEHMPQDDSFVLVLHGDTRTDLTHSLSTPDPHAQVDALVGQLRIAAEVLHVTSFDLVSYHPTPRTSALLEVLRESLATTWSPRHIVTVTTEHMDCRCGCTDIAWARPAS